MVKIKLNADRVVSISAIMISLMTLVVLVLQTNMIRHQQRNSVYPHMMMGNQGYGGANFAFIMTNSGIGPAIIESVEINYQDSIYQMDLPSFFFNYIEGTDTLSNVLHSNVYPGMLVPAEKTIKFFEVDNNLESAVSLMKAFNQLREEEFEMVITYKSIYEDRWKLSTNSGTPVSID